MQLMPEYSPNKCASEQQEWNETKTHADKEGKKRGSKMEISTAGTK